MRPAVNRPELDVNAARAPGIRILTRLGSGEHRVEIERLPFRRQRAGAPIFRGPGRHRLRFRRVRRLRLQRAPRREDSHRDRSSVVIDRHVGVAMHIEH